MRPVGIFSICMSAALCCSCFCGDYLLFWLVEGEFVQAESQTPLSGEVIGLRLFRDGEMIGRQHTPIPLDSQGAFQLPISVGGSGSCGLPGLEFPPPHAPLGAPPDEIEIVLQTADDIEIRFVVPVLEENITEINEVRGVEISGVIILGQIVVPDDG